MCNSVFSYVIRKPLQGLRNLVSKRAFEEENVQGKIAIVTGANKGIGKEVTYELANRGVTVIMACRNLEAVKESIVEIRNKTFLGTLIPMQLDLASLESVHNFVTAFKARFNHVDILINNAGVMIPDKQTIKTREGFEINVGTNFLGHFLLTNLLMELLRKSDFARVVHVSSLSMKYANLNYEKPLEINIKRKSIYPLGYCNSKFALALFNLELAKRTSNLNVRTYCLCPGCVYTDISDFITADWIGVLQRIKFLQKYLLLSPSQASQSIIYCATAKECARQSGELYRRCKLWGDSVYPDDLFVPGDLPDLNDEDAKKLWKASEKLTKIDTDSLYL
ncbi:unnamed protein product [Allacma fusca]|uniref:Uncharacterized protein n=1 Tax=Allacma fusca TaxID=39272 RepID=A0A8J2J9S3_9HEXA|nr:unnamed protein product [Allacma fusca]